MRGFPFAGPSASLILLAASLAYADEAPKPPDVAPPLYTFTEDQAKVIAESAMQHRAAAAAEYKKWDDLIAEIVRQAQRIQSVPPRAAPPEAKP